jgi:hypothetical protein
MNKDNFRKYGILLSMVGTPIVLVGAGYRDIVDGFLGYVNGSYPLISLLDNNLIMQCVVGVIGIGMGLWIAWAVYPSVKVGIRDYLKD